MIWHCYICERKVRRKDTETVGEVVLCASKECHKDAWLRVMLAAERKRKKSDGESGK